MQITEAVTSFLTSHPDQVLTAEEIAEGIGKTREQVFSALHNVRKQLPGVTNVGRGTYRYSPALDQVLHKQKIANEADSVMLLQVMHDDGDKRLVLDEHNGLWVLKRLAEY